MKLLSLEARLESIFEKLLGGTVGAETIMRTVARAFENSALPPSHITISLHPQNYEALVGNYPHIDQQIAAYVVELERSMGRQVSKPPQVLLEQSAELDRGKVAVHAIAQPEPEQPTDKLENIHTNHELPPPLAQLWREGKFWADLERYVINIGRRADNHLVLDDPRVSRQHCQLRLKNGRYIIYDLESRHGVFVNGTPTTEHILTHGDVISLGGVQLIYLEDDSTEQMGKAGDTKIRNPFKRS